MSRAEKGAEAVRFNRWLLVAVVLLTLGLGVHAVCIRWFMIPQIQALELRMSQLELRAISQENRMRRK